MKIATDRIEPNKLYSPQEIIDLKLIPFGSRTVRNMIRNGELPSRDMKRGMVSRYMIEGKDIISWWKKHKKNRVAA